MLVDFYKNLIIPESTSKYPSEDAVYFLCTSIIDYQMNTRGENPFTLNHINCQS